MKLDSRLNWSFDSSMRYSGSSRRVLSSSRRGITPLGLVATEFVSSTSETDPLWITALRLAVCRVLLVDS